MKKIILAVAHFGARKAHSVAEAQKVADMTESVMADNCPTCTPEGKAWAKAFSTMAVAFGTNFKSQEYQGAAPKTWIDVADSAVKPIASLGEKMIFVGGAVDFADKMMDKMGGSTSIQMGDGGTIDGSFNTESHESTASTLYGDAEINNEHTASSKDVSSDDDAIDEDDPLYCTGDSQCEEGFVCDEPIFTCVRKDY